MYQRFKPGDEVSICKHRIGGSDIYDHTLTVARLAGAAVVLSDGSRWRQDGWRWGEKSYRSFSDYLMERKNALRDERSRAEEQRRIEAAKYWKNAVSGLLAISVSYRKAEAEAALVDLLAWVRALPEEQSDD
jgi:hypothetical protein